METGIDCTGGDWRGRALIVSSACLWVPKTRVCAGATDRNGKSGADPCAWTWVFGIGARREGEEAVLLGGRGLRCGEVEVGEVRCGDAPTVGLWERFSIDCGPWSRAG